MGWFKRLPSGLGVFIALTLLAPVLALTALAIRAAAQSPLESASAPEPLMGTVETMDRFQQVAVAIKVEFTDALSPAIAASGTVTQVIVAPGQTVTSGTVLATVNDLPVIAYTGATPLWRDLSRGATGDDVRVAQTFLQAWGYYNGAIDGNLKYATEQAIKAFNKANGGGTNNPVLSLSSLAWIGPSDVTVAALSIGAGDSASPGAALFTTTASLAAIAVTETPNIVRDAPVVLQVGPVTTPYEVGSGRVTDPEVVAAIAAFLGQATDGTGNVSLVTPRTVGTVPSSAIVVDEQSRTCMFANLTDPGILVEPLGGSLGTVDLDNSLAGQTVLFNPREVREDLSCG
jgi:peptidoglycan hydrolase-like protein with peptidoglycan-binding domain